MNFNRIVLFTISVMLLSTLFLSAKDINILPYKDRGIKYYPKYVKKGYVKYGKASWYGKPFHGKRTANGERYNMYSMTAAHRTYAMGTILKITNLKNRRSVKVRINDRGPFYNTRNIDLSYGAARRLGMVNKGVGKVKIEVLSSKKRKRYSKKLHQSKHKIKISKNGKRQKKIQVAFFYNKAYAKIFRKKYNLKNSMIVKKYIKDKNKIAYRVIVKCTPWEAKKLLKSKKFSGAYIIS